MKNKVTRDGDFIIVPIPEADINSMARFIAHGLYNKPINQVITQIQDIVVGDILKQDEYVQEFVKTLEIEKWVMVLNGPEALKMCDELAETIYDDTKKQPKERHLKVITICVYCHKSKIKNEKCECEVTKE